jgi:hypothetical protein
MIMIYNFSIINNFNKRYIRYYLISYILEFYVIHMHPEDLNSIWFCEDCQSSFFFNSDAEDHKEKTRHNKMRKFSAVSGGTISK